ncbi:MAG: hypothetical protein MJA31_02175 [Clostridia bacterium]|nr:hypothetical protein [Clostridia bacterium]
MENKYKAIVANEFIKNQRIKVMELKDKCIDILEEMKVMDDEDLQLEILSKYIMEKEHLRDYEVEYVLLRGIQIGREIEKLNK